MILVARMLRKEELNHYQRREAKAPGKGGSQRLCQLWSGEKTGQWKGGKHCKGGALQWVTSSGIFQGFTASLFMTSFHIPIVHYFTKTGSYCLSPVCLGVESAGLLHFCHSCRKRDWGENLSCCMACLYLVCSFGIWKKSCVVQVQSISQNRTDRCFPSLIFMILLTTAGMKFWLNLITLHLILERHYLLAKA